MRKLSDYVVALPSVIHPVNDLLLLRSRWCMGYERVRRKCMNLKPVQGMKRIQKYD